MILLKKYFLNDEQLFLSVENNILSLLSHTFYLKGFDFSLDTVTLTYYKNSFLNTLRSLVSQNILEQIIFPTRLFSCREERYLKECLSIILYSLTPKPELEIKVGVASASLNWINFSSIKLLERKLAIHQNINLSIYSRKETYDLVITDISSNLLVKNYDTCLRVTSLGVTKDIKQISKEIDLLTKKKYKPFSINNL